jgi:3-deoxy-manno-octulosonate cytidylyltransferase (CMP-KDO synthetase)
MTPIILIPARMAATRLPGKPLRELTLRGKTKAMILHVIDRAVEADVGPVVVAAGDAEIVEAVEKAGHRAVLTAPSLPSGTDRIWAALSAIDPTGRHDVILNVQGDEPTLSPVTIRKVLEALQHSHTDMATAVTPFASEVAMDNPNQVKAIIVRQAVHHDLGRALSFTRMHQMEAEGDVLHHLGIYAYTRKALEQFVHLPQSEREKRERLEQLRAIDAGMTIAVAVVEKASRGVDTPEDIRALEAEDAAKGP